MSQPLLVCLRGRIVRLLSIELGRKGIKSLTWNIIKLNGFILKKVLARYKAIWYIIQVALKRDILNLNITSELTKTLYDLKSVTLNEWHQIISKRYWQLMLKMLYLRSRQKRHQQLDHWKLNQTTSKKYKQYASF